MHRRVSSMHFHIALSAEVIICIIGVNLEEFYEDEKDAYYSGQCHDEHTKPWLLKIVILGGYWVIWWVLDFLLGLDRLRSDRCLTWLVRECQMDSLWLLGEVMWQDNVNIESMRHLVWHLNCQEILVWILACLLNFVQDELGLFWCSIVKVNFKVAAWEYSYFCLALISIQSDAFAEFGFHFDVTHQLNIELSHLVRVQHRFLLWSVVSRHHNLDILRCGSSIILLDVLHHTEESLKFIDFTICFEHLWVLTLTLDANVLSDQRDSAILHNWHDLFILAIKEESESYSVFWT